MWLTALATIAKRTGYPVVERAGWKTRGRAPMSGAKSIICHHTAGGPSGNYPSLGVVQNGRAGLPGPLAHYGLGRDGTIYVIAAGRANHAGVVDTTAHSNSYAIGIEAENTGRGEKWSNAQMDAYAKLCRELCDHYGIPISQVRGHREVARPKGRKVDPSFDMNAFRKMVKARKGTGGSTPTTTGGGSGRTYKTVNYGTTLGKWDKGDPVRDWQDFLVDQGHKLKVDGYFGDDTVKGTKSYQKKVGVKADGMAGADTIGKAKADGFTWKRKGSAPRPAPKPKTPDAPKFPFPKGHWMGVESSNPKNHSGYHARDRAGIKVWQSRMKARGWAITVDGRFGSQSERVARQFQRQVGVAQDGLVGEVTFEKSWTAPIT